MLCEGFSVDSVDTSTKDIIHKRTRTDDRPYLVLILFEDVDSIDIGSIGRVDDELPTEREGEARKHEEKYRHRDKRYRNRYGRSEWSHKCTERIKEVKILGVQSTYPPEYELIEEANKISEYEEKYSGTHSNREGEYRTAEEEEEDDDTEEERNKYLKTNKFLFYA